LKLCWKVEIELNPKHSMESIPVIPLSEPWLGTETQPLYYQKLCPFPHKSIQNKTPFTWTTITFPPTVWDECDEVNNLRLHAWWRWRRTPIALHSFHHNFSNFIRAFFFKNPKPNFEILIFLKNNYPTLNYKNPKP